MQKSTRLYVVKIVALLLVLALAMPLMVACADFFFDKVDQRDREQVVASIPIQAQRLLDINGIETGDVVYPARTIEVRKGDLIQELNANGQSLIQEEGMSLERATRISLEEVIFDEIERAFIEIEFARGQASELLPEDTTDINTRVIKQGVEWFPLVDSGDVDSGRNYVNYNQVLRQVYQALQDEIFRVGDEILEQRGEELRPDVTQPSLPTPPHPVPSTPDTEDVVETSQWVSDYYPGDNVDPYYASLDRAAFRRVLNSFDKNLDSDYRLTDRERQLHREQLRDINSLITQGEFRQAYDKLGNDLIEYDRDSLLYWSLGRQAFDSVQQEVFYQYIESLADDLVQDSDVQARYAQILARQQADFVDMSNFYTVADSDDLILLDPTSDIFWVKHILLQFNDAQKAQLEALKSSSASRERYEFERTRLANAITVRAKQNGYEVGEAMTVDLVYEQVNAIMTGLEGSTFEANSAFDSLIYRFNADPGIFNKLERGYMVQPNRNNSANPNDDDYGLDLQWVKEFAQAAKDLRQAYDEREIERLTNPNLPSRLGSISDMVVTDNGIHILYLSDVTSTGRVKSLKDWATAGRTKTVRETIADMIASTIKSNARTTWRSMTLTNYDPTNGVTRYDSRISDIWK
jgi:hypothetical protein